MEANKVGTFNNPLPTEGLTHEQMCDRIDAGVILDLRAPEDKAADEAWSSLSDGMPSYEECMEAALGIDVLKGVQS